MGYKLLIKHITSDHEKDTTILFYKIQTDTNAMLSKLLFEYSTQKHILKTKHEKVLKYINDSGKNPLDIDLKEIQTLINDRVANKPYNIYISDENYVIRNTTYKPDMGFNLSFAKTAFDEHFAKKEIGCCSPLFEKSSKNFFSYSDSYILKDGKQKGILQISYNYPQTKIELADIQKNLDKYPAIKDAKAYILVNTGFVNDLILKDFPSYKPTLEEIQNRIKDGTKVQEKLEDKTIYIDTFVQDGTPFKNIYLSTKSGYFDDTKIIYSLLFDESEYHNRIKNLNIIMALVTIIGLVAIVILNVIRNKEIKLSHQDKFVQSAMHELKTPLSIITLNNDLRREQFGEDRFSTQIDSAIKVLQNSYNDMSYVIKHSSENYQVEIVDLEEIVEERIEYFLPIVQVNDRILETHINSECQVKISVVELTRLIDNNLSNAIKYSERNSTITIILEENSLQFITFGTPIKDVKKVFTKYYRENQIVGGYGLGLGIVKEIAKTYKITTILESDAKNGTNFTYQFKCHFDAIS